MEHTYESCDNLTCRRKERYFGYNQALEDVIVECERFKNQYKTFYFQDLVDISKKLKAKYKT